MSARHAKRLDGYKLSHARLVVGRVRDSYDRDADQFPVEYIGGSQANHEPNVTVKGEGVNKRGEFIAMIEIDWEDERLINDFVFRTYCADPVQIEEIKEYEAGDFLKNALSHCAHLNTQLTTFENRGFPDIGISNGVNECKAGYSLIYAENNNRYKAVRLKFMLPEYSGLDFE